MEEEVDVEKDGRAVLIATSKAVGLSYSRKGAT